MCDVGYFVEGEEGGGPLMLDVACNMGRNMGSLGTVSWKDVGCYRQHAHNMDTMGSLGADGFDALNLMDAEASDVSAHNGCLRPMRGEISDAD
jgi:hypothetical protein